MCFDRIYQKTSSDFDSNWETLKVTQLDKYPEWEAKLVMTMETAQETLIEKKTEEFTGTCQHLSQNWSMNKNKFETILNNANIYEQIKLSIELQIYDWKSLDETQEYYQDSVSQNEDEVVFFYYFFKNNDLK